MQVLLHFLFQHLLSPEKAKEIFRDCWPIYDQKVQGRDFKKHSYTLLAQLEKEGKLPANTVRLSHLQTCSGERFNYMLWHLSTLTLRTVMERKHSGYPTPPMPSLQAGQLQNASIITRSTKMHIARQAQIFVDHATKAAAAEQQWRTFAAGLEEEHERLSRDMNEVREKRKELKETVEKAGIVTAKAEIEERLVKFRNLWHVLQAHHENNAKNRELAEEIMEHKTRANRLNAVELIPLLTKHNRTTLTQKDTLMVTSSCQPLIGDNKVDLLQLIKLWNLTLRDLQGRLEKLRSKAIRDEQQKENERGSVTKRRTLSLCPALSEAEEHLRQQLQRHKNHLSALRALNQRLSSDLPELRRQAVTLQDKAAQRRSQQQKMLRQSASSRTNRRRSNVSSSVVTNSTPSRPSGTNLCQLIPPTPAVASSKRPSPSALSSPFGRHNGEDGTGLNVIEPITPLPIGKHQDSKTNSTTRSEQERVAASVRRNAHYHQQKQRPQALPLPLPSSTSSSSAFWLDDILLEEKSGGGREQKSISNNNIFSPISATHQTATTAPTWGERTKTKTEAKENIASSHPLSPVRGLASEFSTLFSPLIGSKSCAASSANARPCDDKVGDASLPSSSIPPQLQQHPQRKKQTETTAYDKSTLSSSSAQNDNYRPNKARTTVATHENELSSLSPVTKRETAATTIDKKELGLNVLAKDLARTYLSIVEEEVEEEISPGKENRTPISIAPFGGYSPVDREGFAPKKELLRTPLVDGKTSVQRFSDGDQHENFDYQQEDDVDEEPYEEEEETEAVEEADREENEFDCYVEECEYEQEEEIERGVEEEFQEVHQETEEQEADEERLEHEQEEFEERDFEQEEYEVEEDQEEFEGQYEQFEAEVEYQQQEEQEAHEEREQIAEENELSSIESDEEAELQYEQEVDELVINGQEQTPEELELLALDMDIARLAKLDDEFEAQLRFLEEEEEQKDDGLDDWGDDLQQTKVNDDEEEQEEEQRRERGQFPYEDELTVELQMSIRRDMKKQIRRTIVQPRLDDSFFTSSSDDGISNEKEERVIEEENVLEASSLLVEENDGEAIMEGAKEEKEEATEEESERVSDDRYDISTFSSTAADQSLSAHDESIDLMLENGGVDDSFALLGVNDVDKLMVNFSIEQTPLHHNKRGTKGGRESSFFFPMTPMEEVDIHKNSNKHEDLLSGKYQAFALSASPFVSLPSSALRPSASIQRFIHQQQRPLIVKNVKDSKFDFGLDEPTPIVAPSSSSSSSALTSASSPFSSSSSSSPLIASPLETPLCQTRPSFSSSSSSSSSSPSAEDTFVPRKLF
ncbi:hypothetical protein QOT17_004754 [Balamuthia mandrillaris]